MSRFKTKAIQLGGFILCLLGGVNRKVELLFEFAIKCRLVIFEFELSISSFLLPSSGQLNLVYSDLLLCFEYNNI